MHLAPSSNFAPSYDPPLMIPPLCPATTRDVPSSQEPTYAIEERPSRSRTRSYNNITDNKRRQIQFETHIYPNSI